MPRTTRSAASLVLAVGLAAPAVAQAHVTVQPEQATAGSFTVESVRVPNETDNATTTKIAVRLPPGFASVSYAKVPGWSVSMTTSKPATPIKTDDGEVDVQVDQVTFTAAKGAGIAPGQFVDFPLSVGIPDKPQTLTFKAIQTYDNGDVVRWIGAPDADEPAPQVKVTAGSADTAAQAAPAAAAAPVAAAKDDDGNGLSIVALVVGGLGLAAGLGALAMSRRRPAA